MHVVLYLPSAFYSAIASTFVEILQAINDVRGREVFTFEFVSKNADARSKSGISFPAKARPSRKMDVLVLLTGAGKEILESVQALEDETKRAKSLILLAKSQGALIAATCGASYILASLGLLNGKRATISWWLKHEAKSRFPQVRWEPSRIVVRHGSIYTTGAAFAGLELISKLLIDLGFAEEERQARKLMVLPPARESQNPYEIPGVEESTSFEKTLNQLAQKHIAELDLPYLAKRLSASPRTLSRKFLHELHTSPGKWIQEQRLEKARILLESTTLSVSEICFRIGYQDVASFGRLFSKSTAMTPSAFRRELRSAV